MQEGGPVKAGGQFGQVGGGGRVVDLVDLATLDRGPVLLGDLGLEGQDVGGGLGRIGPAGGGQGAGDIGDIGFTLRREVGLQVVVAVRQAQAPLAHIGRVEVGVLQVLEHIDAEQGAAEARVAFAHQASHAAVVGDGADGGQVSGERLGAQLVDAGLVHEAGVEGADLLRIGVGRVGGAGLDDGLQLALGVFVQDVERAEAGLVRGDLGIPQIGPVGVGVEVVARFHGQVATVQVKAPGMDLRRVRGNRGGVAGVGVLGGSGLGGEREGERQAGGAHQAGLGHRVFPCRNRRAVADHLRFGRADLDGETAPACDQLSH
ncbi:hypothetical protein D3C85_868670 [compost metagenome]